MERGTSNRNGNGNRERRVWLQNRNGKRSSGENTARTRCGAPSGDGTRDMSPTGAEALVGLRNDSGDNPTDRDRHAPPTTPHLARSLCPTCALWYVAVSFARFTVNWVWRYVSRYKRSLLYRLGARWLSIQLSFRPYAVYCIWIFLCEFSVFLRGKYSNLLFD